MMFLPTPIARQSVAPSASYQPSFSARVQTQCLSSLGPNQAGLGVRLSSNAMLSDTSRLIRSGSRSCKRQSAAMASRAAQVKIYPSPSSKQLADSFWKAASLALVVGLRVTKLAIRLASNLVSQVANDVVKYWAVPRGRPDPPPSQPEFATPTPSTRPDAPVASPPARLPRPFEHVLHVLTHLVLDPCTTLDRRLAVMETYTKTESELSGHFQRLIRASCESAQTAEHIYGGALPGQAQVTVDSAFWKHSSTQAVIEEEEALKRRVFEQVYYDLHKGGDTYIRNVRD